MSVGAKGLAFVGYPVTDVDRAMDFYADALGLTCTMDETVSGSSQRWVEFAVGDATLAISNAWPPSGQSGPSAAIEVSNLEAALATLREKGATIESDVIDCPGCRFFLISDPDGNSLIIHRLKSSPEA